MELLDIKIRRRPDVISGIKVREGKAWLLIKHNPVDYVLDGYGLINKDFLQKKIPLKKDDIKHKILSLKESHLEDVSNLELDNTLTLFNFLKENKILIQVELESSDYCLIGTVDRINDKSFVLNEISVKGEFLKQENLKYNVIRNIYLKNDYLESYENYLKYHSNKNA